MRKHYSLILLSILFIQSCKKDADFKGIPEITFTRVETYAEGYGYQDGPLANAKFQHISGMCFDPSGNLYVSEFLHHRIRKITPGGIVSTFAGSVQGYQDGPGATAKFFNPAGLCSDPQGNIYVAESGNSKIRKIAPDGTVSTIAGTVEGNSDGDVSVAKLEHPFSICIDREGTVFFTQETVYCIRKVTTNGQLITVAGRDPGYLDNYGMNAKFHGLLHMCVGPDGNFFITETGGPRIRKMTPSAYVSTFAGGTEYHNPIDGQGTSARFKSFLGSICVDGKGNMYVMDQGVIKKITIDAYVSTVGGSYNASEHRDGPIGQALFYQSTAMALSPAGDLFIAEFNRIRRVTGN